MATEQHPFITGRWKNGIKNLDVSERWFINRNHENEVISFAFMPNKKVTSIFLGSFPIWEIVGGELNNGNMEFFYGSVVNDFWRCLGDISKSDIRNLNSRVNILDEFKIGITDILHTVIRQPDTCSSDNCLTASWYNDILDLKRHFPLLKNIFITSGGQGPIPNLNERNRNVATWLRNSWSNRIVQGFNNRGFVKQIMVNGVSFNLIYLFSPSNSANTALQGILNRYNHFGTPELTIQEFRKIQWCYFLKKYHLADYNKENVETPLCQENISENLVRYFDA